jgi:predicted glutamine amidotransferase
MCRWLAYSGTPIQVATSDGASTWAFRYSSEGRSRSLYFSTAIHALRELYPQMELFRSLDDETRIVLSEPLGDLPGAWNEVPESTWGCIQPGQDVLEPFIPVSPG